MQNGPVEISVISPVYQGEQSIVELVTQIQRVLESLAVSFEIILVEDGSPDDSWNRIRNLCKADSRVKGIRLSRNFGQHQAITAGLQASRGKFVAIMDCDLQDDPIYLKSLYEKAKAGFDIVYTEKAYRSHPLVKNIFALAFSFLYNLVIQHPRGEMKPSVGAYSMISRKVVEAFLRVNDYQRHYLCVLRWLGFQSTSISVSHRVRPYGRSSYTFRKAIVHGIDGIVSQSDRLLHFSISTGLFFFVVSICSTVYYVFQYFSIAHPVAGWTSLMVLILMSTGLILMSLGILGLYLGKMFEQVKGRPLFFVDHTENF